MSFTLNLHDLQFVLKQIKIAEAHSNGAALTEIRLDAAGNVIADASQYHAVTGAYLGDPGAPRAIPDAKTPFGLRTVDGSYNNLVEGRELWGAADQPMPRFFAPNYINDADGDTFDPDGPGPSPTITNNNYGIPGSVADADPRIISNLVADMSPNNPAALYAALVFAESENPYGDLAELMAARVTPAQAVEMAEAAQIAFDAALPALNAAVAAYAANTSTDPLVIADLIDDIQEAATAVNDLGKALDRANALADDPEAAFLALAEEKGLVIEDGSLVIPNVAPDEGISAPFNAWMTFFGQFFDHGLDLISKGGNGTIYIPLQPDDPLYVEGGHTNFMVLTRSTTVFDENGVPTQRNVTTPFVDQNQTYTSHASHQVFLREYHIVDGVPVATGKLLEGANGGLATWADVKAQALMLGIELTDHDVGSVPLLRTDAYGNFIPDANGYAQVIVDIGADGIPNTSDDTVVSRTSNGGVAVNTWTVGAVRTNNAFLDDIAHNAVPVVNELGVLQVDADTVVGNAVASVNGRNTEYDNELLDRHFITGDGRGNENFGLTAVHHIFHSEHNRQTVIQKLTILEEGSLAFVNEWLAVGISQDTLNSIRTALNNATDKNEFIHQLEDGNIATGATNFNLVWDGERIFQAARFSTEMQYQHLVFEEFGRKIQPAIDPFVFNSVTDINPAIFAEFANVVYRFGHSMLTDSLPRAFLDPNGENYLNIVDEGLVAAFLDPVDYDLDGGITHEAAAGAVVRGLTNVRGNAIDEFVVGALRNNLLGLPLDLAAINIARGRDTGMPTLNQAREQLFAATGHSFLKPYDNWAEFAAGLKNPLSVVNFIAAYGTHAAITAETTLDGKRAVAWELVFGVDANGNPTTIVGRDAFINGTGAYATNKGGLDNVDLWIGGLAEKILLFGGMLGSTFTAVFEAQMEALQDADRFYYLTRTQGLNFLDALENNAFAKMIMANTDLTDPGPDGIRGTADDVIRHHIGIDSFANYDYILEVNQQYQQDYNGDEPGKDPNDIDDVLAGLGFSQVNRTLPPAFEAYYDNYLRFIGGEHVVLGGTSGNDVLIGDLGDDAIWGGAGNDYIEGGQGVDLIMGGAGDDIILDQGDEGDFIKGDDGDDVISSSNGLDVLMGGAGKDVIFAGKDDTEVFGGEGDDFILGGDGVDFLLGNEGDDWIEGGAGFDTTAGDNSELFFNSTVIGHDVMFAGSDEHDFDAESGDDIMVQGESVIRNEGMFGFDWAIYKGVEMEAYADMRIRIFTTEEQDILRNRFDKVEALSGWKYDDVLIGDDRVFGEFPELATVNNTENIFYRDELDQAGIDRIAGLDQIITPDLLRTAVYGSDFSDVVQQIFTGGNILLGGGGSDTITGGGGDDVIDGDRWLNVRIRITEPGEDNTPGNQISTIDSLKHTFTASDAADPSWIGKSLFELLIDRVIVPSQLHIVREILSDPNQGYETDGDGNVLLDQFGQPVPIRAIDTAVYWDVRANYTVTDNEDGSYTVEHTGFDDDDVPDGSNLISDGRDTLYNIERLQFSDMIVNIVPFNTAPEATSGFETIGHNTTLSSFVIGFDAESGNDLAFFVADGPDNGDLIFNVDGTYTYTPFGTFVDGVDSFQFVAYDGFLYSEIATIEITVVPNTAPVPSADPEVREYFLLDGNIYSGPAPINETVYGFLDPGFDEDGDTLSYFLTGPVVGGTVELTLDGFFVFEPNLDFAGEASFFYVLRDHRDANPDTGLPNYLSESIAKQVTIIYSNGLDLSGGDVNEIAANGTVVGLLTAPDDTYTFSLLENAGGRFTIVGNQIRVANGLLLDFEQNASHIVKVQATNGLDTLLQDFTIDVNDVDPELVVANAGGYTFVGGNGNDTFRSNVGPNIMMGGGGNDVYYVNNAADQVIENVGEGIDTVYARVSYALLPGFGSEVEVLRANAGNTGITLAGNAYNNTLISGAGNDRLSGGRGNDIYYVNNAGDRVIETAGHGTDTVYASVSFALQSGFGSEVEILQANAGTTGIRLTGNAYNNTLISGAGDDTLVGGRGNDIYYVNNAGDRVLEGAGNGNDIVYASVTYALEAGSHVEHLRAIAGTDDIGLRGNELANTVVGNDGDNIIAGGAGNDVLTGNGGQDSFLFDTALNGATNVDRITDFETDDTILLNKAIFTAFASFASGSVIAAENFHSAAGATQAADVDDRIIYNVTTGDLYYDGDGLGGGAAVRFATLTPNLSLTNADFVVI